MANNSCNVTAFVKLKPLCVNFLKERNIENVEKLENAIKEFDEESIGPLLEFIALPVRACLSAKLPEKITIKCINILTQVFHKSEVKSWLLFSDIFMFMITKISSLEDFNKVIDGNEELKQCVCENISGLVRNSSEEVLNEMYSLSFRPNLAQAFYTLNLLLSHEKSKALQKIILSTIGMLAYNEKYVKKRVKMTEEIASEALASCLPGVSVALQKLACGDIKQGHAVILMAVNVLADLIVLVVGDESYKRGVVNATSSEVYYMAYKCGKHGAFSESDISKKIPVTPKDEEWFKIVSEKLEILIKNITVLAGHDHWKVRLEFLSFSKSILFKCTNTLKNCVSVLLPSVFGLSVDSNDAVTAYCSGLIVSFSEYFQNINDTSLNSIIEKNIENLTSQLIKSKLSANDNKKLLNLKCLQGYIEILGTSINTFIFTMAHLEKILLTLITLLEFDTFMLDFVEEIPVLESFDMTNPIWPKKKFKFFENEEILQVTNKICYSLAKIENSWLLVDYLLDKLSCNDLYTLQCIFIIGNIMEGFSKKNNQQKYSDLVNDVLEIFLAHTLFDVSVKNKINLNSTEEYNQQSSLDVPNTVLNRNKLQICLLLEAIAKCSICLRDGFKVYLMKVLCPVMEKTGSSIFTISQYGRLSLYFIAVSCGYNSVKDLIKDNSDYITNMLLVNFHQYWYKHESAVVLQVAMEQSDADAIVLFRDLIFQILNILDYNQNKAYFFMRILFSTVVSVKEWFPSKKIKDMNNFVSNDTTKCKSLKSSVLEYFNARKLVHSLESENINDELNEQINLHSEDTDDLYSVNEEKPSIPLHINITCEIFKRCIHLQSSEDTYLRMLTLETVEQCIIILRDFENELHPLIHEFWSPFLNRFTEETFTSKAFNVLLAIAKECGDFIRSRTFKDVMPKLVQFLKKECSKSYLKGNFKHYQWTGDHSLQVLVLSEIGNLCTKLDIDDKLINDVANACLPYLEKEQPAVLQDAAIKSLKVLGNIDPDALWFYWHVLYSKENTILPPTKDFIHVSFPYSNNNLTTSNLNFLH